MGRHRVREVDRTDRGCGRYANTYVGLFRVVDGRVVLFKEFFDPIVLNEAFGDLYTDLEPDLRLGLSAEFAQLAEPTYWSKKTVTVAELSTEQRTAVEAADQHGYYETPGRSRCRSSPRNSTCRGRRSNTAYSRPSSGSPNGSFGTRRWAMSRWRSENGTPSPSRPDPHHSGHTTFSTKSSPTSVIPDVSISATQSGTEQSRRSPLFQ